MLLQNFLSRRQSRAAGGRVSLILLCLHIPTRIEKHASFQFKNGQFLKTFDSLSFAVKVKISPFKEVCTIYYKHIILTTIHANVQYLRYKVDYPSQGECKYKSI